MKTAFTKPIKSVKIMPELLFKKRTTSFQNAAIVKDLAALEAIHDQEKNIAVFERTVDEMKAEIDLLLSSNFQIRLSGSEKEILKKLTNALGELETPSVFNDVKTLLETFKKISETKSFRFGLFVMNSDMCKRFHTDINDLRMLCTYSGQGTFWLPEEAADRNVHHDGGENEAIVVKPKLIQQTKTGDVLILKGALYPGAKAAIHRSPSIEESNEKRLLLRIDTNENLIF